MQAAHAALDFAVAYPKLTFGWHSSSNTLALLAACDELELCWLLASAKVAGITAVPFREPDLDDGLTAVAVEPAGWRLCRKYPLALREGVKTSG